MMADNALVTDYIPVGSTAIDPVSVNGTSVQWSVLLSPTLPVSLTL